MSDPEIPVFLINGHILKKTRRSVNSVIRASMHGPQSTETPNFYLCLNSLQTTPSKNVVQEKILRDPEVSVCDFGGGCGGDCGNLCGDFDGRELT